MIINNFYVYAHVKKDTDEIFYIGKGKGNRAWATRHYNKYWTRIAIKHGFKVLFLFENLDEKTALDKEKEVIKKLKQDGIKLTNLTDGGDGALSVLMSEEVRKKQKISMGRPEVREKISAITKEKWMDKNHREMMIKAQIKNNKRIKSIENIENCLVFRSSIEAGNYIHSILGIGKNSSAASASIYAACKQMKKAYGLTWRFL